MTSLGEGEMTNELGELEKRKNEATMLMWLAAGIVLIMLPIVDVNFDINKASKIYIMQIVMYIIGIALYAVIKKELRYLFKYYVIMTFIITYAFMIMCNINNNIWAIAIPLMLVLTIYMEQKMLSIFDASIFLINLTELFQETHNLNAEAFVDRSMKLIFIAIIALASLYVVQCTKYTHQRVVQLANKVIKDDLTGLYNRYFLENAFSEAGEENKSFDASFALIDIDDFKKINDTYGHKFGDVVLQALANSIEESVYGERTYAIRIGGDEFAIISFEHSKETLGSICRTLQDKINNTMIEINGEIVKFTVSIGIAEQENMEKSDYQVVYNKADIALYAVKKKIKGNIVIER